jgi:CRISPR/Cas system CMR-associated protein Cmr1 (group 7 of RAMP superfamily)
MADGSTEINGQGYNSLAEARVLAWSCMSGIGALVSRGFGFGRELR